MMEEETTFDKKQIDKIVKYRLNGLKISRWIDLQDDIKFDLCNFDWGHSFDEKLKVSMEIGSYFTKETLKSISDIKIEGVVYKLLFNEEKTQDKNQIIGFTYSKTFPEHKNSITPYYYSLLLDSGVEVDLLYLNKIMMELYEPLYKKLSTFGFNPPRGYEEGEIFNVFMNGNYEKFNLITK